MADSKITALTALTAADPANDMIPIVDVSDTPPASGNTKRISINNILACSPSATLASATITGDLTVDTNTLYVNSSTNNVGLGTLTPSGASGRALEIYGGAGQSRIVLKNDTTGSASTDGSQIALVGSQLVIQNREASEITFETNNSERYRLDSTGVATWSNVGGVAGTAMTLNANGLGVGVVSANGIKLSSFVTTDGAPATSGTTQTSGSLRIGAASTTGAMDMGTAGSYSWIQVLDRGNLAINYDLVLQKNGGNVGIGVTPSAWDSANYKALQVSRTAVASLSNIGIFAANWFADAGGDKYIATATAARIDVNNGGGIQFKLAPSGTAGTAITFTQAMTLDASGNLLVGKAVSLFSTIGVEASGTGFLSATNSASTNATTNLSIYSTGAAAFRFYVGLGGTVYATNTTISAISDARLKENVQDIDVGLGAILALKPRKFDWKAGKGKDIKGDRGFIAQEFEQVFPQLVDEWKDAAPEGEAPYKSVRQDLIPVLVKAIQELAAEVNALKNA